MRELSNHGIPRQTPHGSAGLAISTQSVGGRPHSTALAKWVSCFCPPYETDALRPCTDFSPVLSGVSISGPAGIAAQVRLGVAPHRHIPSKSRQHIQAAKPYVSSLESVSFGDRPGQEICLRKGGRHPWRPSIISVSRSGWVGLYGYLALDPSACPRSVSGPGQRRQRSPRSASDPGRLRDVAHASRNPHERAPKFTVIGGPSAALGSKRWQGRAGCPQPAPP
jgi:hypothetical protein